MCLIIIVCFIRKKEKQLKNRMNGNKVKIKVFDLRETQKKKLYKKKLKST